MRYGTKVVATTIAVVLAVGTINYLADPYGVFRKVVDDTPIAQPRFEANVRMAKAHIVARYRPEAVVMGTSRAEIGLSPGHAGWQQRRVYNLGLPAASMREMRDYFAHAVATGGLEQAVIALDFFQFNPLLQPRPDFDECRLRTPGSLWTTLRAALCDLPVLLFSRQTFMASVGRLLPDESESVYLNNGSRDHRAKENSLARAGSQYAAFLETEARYFNSVDHLRGFVVSERTFEETSGPYYEAILRLAHEHGVDLRILISPSHARQWELIHELGIWDEFVRWKRFLVVRAHEVAAEFGASPYAVWDFANYNRYSQEPVPPPEDAQARMRWYWESSHYTQALGDLVLNQVLAGSPNGIGTRLEPNEFEVLAQRVDVRRLAYRNRMDAELQLMREHLQLGARVELTRSPGG